MHTTVSIIIGVTVFFLGDLTKGKNAATWGKCAPPGHTDLHEIQELHQSRKLVFEARYETAWITSIIKNLEADLAKIKEAAKALSEKVAKQQGKNGDDDAKSPRLRHGKSLPVTSVLVQ
jgi:hypothetical protein